MSHDYWHRGVQQVGPSGEEVEKATVYIPDGKLGHFLKRLEQYVETADQDRPRNRDLVDCIQAVGLASLRELWSDDPDDFPGGDDLVWWEVWLRHRGGRELAGISEFAETVGVRLGRRSLGFSNRTVVLVEATADQLAQALNVLDDFAELRKPREPAHLLAEEPATDQSEWVAQLAERTTPAGEDAPAVCIVDTGVHQPHPLLDRSLSATDCHACDPTWNSGDHHGHGTMMAGLALYGALGTAILGSTRVSLRHRLESAKILPPKGKNDPENYGALTATCASLTEIAAPYRARAFSMAVTAETHPAAGEENRDDLRFGQPSSWSAAIDALSAGLSIDIDDGNISLLDADEDAQRLFLVSTGNIPCYQWGPDYLDRCDLSPVEDPAQSWNALSVGAYTALDLIVEEPVFEGWTPVAERGDVSPHSRTSVPFSKVWPIKPDVVLEGGNIARSPADTEFDTPGSLQLLTTQAPLGTQRLLTVTNGTSAATAQAAWLGASILAEYPGFWPETVRALIVHSAEWTPAMLREFDGTTKKAQRTALQRRYGMGVPDLRRATRSASDAVTLIVQDEISPFSTDGTMREMHLHDLPWPTEVLTDHPDMTVRLRVTLSYFIEPNPGARGWVRRYSYASHGLRFDIRRPTETTNEFRKRINAKALTEDERRPQGESDSAEWFFGPNGRVLGSLHTDIWRGTAAALAARGAVAVFPVAGWWKHNQKQENNRRRARYSLILSIETPEQDVDIWTPVAQQVGIPVSVAT